MADGGGSARPAPAPPAGATAARRSLLLALVAAMAGVVLAATGAGLAWATVSAAVELQGVGTGRVGAVEVTANDLFPVGALALLGLVLVVGVAATRGRGRWPVGLALLALGGLLVLGAVVGGLRMPEAALERARTGQLEGVPAGADVRVATPLAGPVLVAIGGLLLAGAGAETLRRGRRWPALGDAHRAPPDRAQPADDTGEPPWEGD